MPSVEGDPDLESIRSEEIDHEASLPTFEILTYPADYTLEVLVDKWRKEQIRVPKFQRQFVWTQVQASKLIESFLLGLPVPPIFLYSDPKTNHLLVVDGQQRLKTIAYFYEGYFGDEFRGARPVFRLTGLNDASPFGNKTYAELEDTDEAAARRLDDSVLRAFVVKQLDPQDDTSIYHIFERLNTGGTFLNSQEIRNAIRQGPFNELLIELNRDSNWRAVYGKATPDRRLRDVELILRFLALLNEPRSYSKPMKDFLNKFMDKYRDPGTDCLAQFAKTFQTTSATVREMLGARPFHIRAGLNAAVFDSVFVAFARNVHAIPKDVLPRYQALIDDDKYLEWVGSATTDEDVVTRRLERAERTLFH